MSECSCLTQKIVILSWKKNLTWKDKFPMFGSGGIFGSIPLTIHAKDINDLELKKKEILKAYQVKYPDRDIHVRVDY